MPSIALWRWAPGRSSTWATCPRTCNTLPSSTPESDELEPLEELERRAIFRALRETGGDKLAAARLLGIGKTTLYRKLKQYETERTRA